MLNNIEKTIDTLNIEKKINSQFFMNLFKNDPLKIISIFSLVIGSLFLLIYFFKVNYFPSDIKINDFIIISTLSFSTGLLMTLFIILISSSPVIIFNFSTKLVQFERIIKKRLDKIRAKKKNNKKYFKIIHTSIIYRELFIFIFISTIAIYLCDSVISIAIAYIISLFIDVYFFKQYYRYMRLKFKIKSIFKLLALYISILTICKTLTLVSIFIFYNILSENKNLQEYNAILLYSGIFSLYFILISIMHIKLFVRILLLFFVFFILLFYTNILHVIPYVIFKKLNLAQVNKNITINEKICITMGIPIHNQVCTIQNARVVWEVGNVYVVDIKVDETSNTYTRYEIPKSSIIIVSKVFEAK